MFFADYLWPATAVLLLVAFVATTLLVLSHRHARRETRLRLAAERKLRRLRKTVEERVAARTAELSVQQSFLRRVIDLNPSLIFAKDADGRFVFANQALAETLGATVDAIVGSDEKRFVHDPQVLAGFRAVDRHVIETGEYVIVDEESLINAAGEERWLSTVKRPIVSPDGTTQMMLGVSVDITGRKAAEQQIRQLNADLERRVAARTLDLNESNLQLERARAESEAASHAKSTFLANMSHEIRTPLNAIIGLTHVLRRNCVEPVNEERLGRVADAAGHLLGIVNEVLDLSKIEAGKLELEVEDFELDGVLECSCELVAQEARRKGLELLIDTEGVPRQLRGDAMRLSQMLVNLLSNAVKFTEQGSVALIGSVLEQSGDGLFLRFEVRDTGIGIPADRLAMLFQAFEQADASTTRRFGGTGLGLAITRHLAQSMHGDAGAESEIGVGSRFWFTVRVEASRSAEADDRQEPRLAGKHALLVDDMAEAREVFEMMLSSMGMRVQTAACGPDAIAAVEASAAAGDPFDVALIDWLMPEMDGIEAARRVLARSGANAPAVVLTSISGDDRMRREALEAGISSFLQKPISFSTLSGHLQALLIGDKSVVTPTLTGMAAEEALRRKHAGARILLAEDNRVNQEVAVSLLELAGLEVFVANTGNEAVSMATAEDYDLILMDMQMPGLDGVQAAHALRDDEATRQTPIIAMTANAYEEDRSACMDAGMNDFVSKPVEPKLLYEVVRRWLDSQARPSFGISGFIASDFGTKTAVAKPLSVSRRSPEVPRVDGLDTQRGLQFFAGQVAAYRAALRQFVELYGTGLSTAEAYLADPGPDTAMSLRRDLHSIAGASAAIGAKPLADLAETIGCALRGTQLGQQAKIASMTREMSRLTSGIRNAWASEAA